jgi:SAM-dependent methyltransferase
VLAVDIEPGGGVQCDAARLPFGDAVFDAVISNHSLEHMDRLGDVLSEIGRVVRAGGGLYVAVPDASTVSDRMYRWVYHGGGHVNPFVSPGALAERITGATGLPLVAVRTLHTSFLFLDRRHFRPRMPRRLWLVGHGNSRAIAWSGYGARVLDRWLGTRFSVYGWAMYFGAVGEPVDTRAWPIVCAGCGTGAAAEFLVEAGAVRRGWFGVRWWRCPGCGVENLFTE